MLTKDDLQAIREMFQINNKVFTTILKIELGETNKRIEAVHRELTKEIQTTNKRIGTVHVELKTEIKGLHTELKTEIKRSEKRLEQKIDKLNYSERIEQSEQKVQRLEAVIKTLTSS
jgi:hypothetical protein